MRLPKLTPKQKAFVDNYLIDLNATQAAIRAGYSKKTAGAVGTENLTKPLIKAAISERLDSRANRTQIDADWVLKTLKEVWDADISDIVENVVYDESGRPSGGRLKPVQDWPPIWRRMVVSFDIEELYEGFGQDRIWTGQVQKLKILGAKKDILKLIGDHVNVKAFQTNIKVDGQIEMVEKIKSAQQRAQSRISVVEQALEQSDN